MDFQDFDGKLEEIKELEIERTVTLPMLSINVDFNDLMEDKGLEEAFDIIGKLKDLLA